ncbi:MAG: SPOR domain-containing protein [Halioglobus sp.]
MNDILKQRLVGALILLALGVVFWPIIFVQPENKTALDQQKFPPPPAVATETIAGPDATGLRASPELAIETPEEVGDQFASSEEPADDPDSEPVTAPAQQSAVAAQVDSRQARSESPQPLSMDANGVPLAWTLQVATVSSAEKAEKLRSRLLAMEQKAYITSVSSGGNRLYRVCVGPKMERAELERIQSRINAEFGVTSLIVRYLP